MPICYYANAGWRRKKKKNISKTAIDTLIYKMTIYL